MLRETSGQPPGLLNLLDSGLCLMPPPSTTLQTWTTWSAAVRMSVPLTTTQTMRTWQSWCAGGDGRRTLTSLEGGTSPQLTDATSFVTKVKFFELVHNKNPSNAEPAVSVYCDGISWVGEPEKGIWCYTRPENPGPIEAQEDTGF